MRRTLAVGHFLNAPFVEACTPHVGRIREKLEDDPASPKLLQTVWGVGYKFESVE